MLHGLLLWALSIVVVFLWAILAMGLVICGFLLGLVIAIVILIVLYGWMNSKVTTWLWFEVETGWLIYFFHGLLLLLVSLIPTLILLVAGALFPWNTVENLQYNYLFIQAPFPQPVAFVVALVLYFTVMGFFGRAVAAVWERSPPPEEPRVDPPETETDGPNEV